ncbi:MAG: polysaccharide deacetylase family protein [Ancalomicrobiaceae bacterium]|nr:polysaccharide deacetylase family protein [Ancalomicrobiaceae bacterium]
MSIDSPRFILFAALALALPASALAETPPVPPQTTSPQPAQQPTAPHAAAICPLPSRAGEKLVRKNVPEAHVAMPDYADLATVPVAAELSGSIRRVELPPGKKLVALTFDLCETPNEVAGYDGEIVETLRAEHVPATFFSGGHWAVTHAARFGEMAADGSFEIGNHTWTHANLRLADPDKLKREILAPIAAFAEVAGRSTCHRPDAAADAPMPRPRLFRFPFGACNPATMKAVNDAGMLAIQWDVATDDASPFRSADMIVKDTLPHVRPGSIILAHANGRGYHTGSALPRLIRELKRRGYEFVTVSELLAAGRPVIAASCYDERPGDTDKYDTWGLHKAAALPKPQPPAAIPIKLPAAVDTRPPAAPRPIEPGLNGRIN